PPLALPGARRRTFAAHHAPLPHPSLPPPAAVATHANCVLPSLRPVASHSCAPLEPATLARSDRHEPALRPDENVARCAPASGPVPRSPAGAALLQGGSPRFLVRPYSPALPPCQQVTTSAT